jgi:hypothetical protein
MICSSQKFNRNAVGSNKWLGSVFMLLILSLAPAASAQDARAILQSAFDNWRAHSSHAVVNMLVKRANSNRSMTMESWTEGDDKALVRFTAPARDAGNATLQLGSATYVFTPSSTR